MNASSARSVSSNRRKARTGPSPHAALLPQRAQRNGGGNEWAGAKRRHPFALQPGERPRAANDAVRAPRSSTTYRPMGRLTVSRLRPSAFIAGHDAPLIGERAATHGRTATEGGDGREV